MFLFPLENRLPSFGSWKEHLAGKLVCLFRPRGTGDALSASLCLVLQFCFASQAFARGHAACLCCCSVCRAAWFLSSGKKLDSFPVCSSSLSLRMRRLLFPSTSLERLLVSSQLREWIQGSHKASMESYPLGPYVPNQSVCLISERDDPKSSACNHQGCCCAFLSKRDFQLLTTATTCITKTNKSNKENKPCKA